MTPVLSVADAAVLLVLAGSAALLAWDALSERVPRAGWAACACAGLALHQASPNLAPGLPAQATAWLAPLTLALALTCLLFAAPSRAELWAPVRTC